jgi:hypothetical protein
MMPSSSKTPIVSVITKDTLSHIFGLQYSNFVLWHQIPYADRASSTLCL